MSRTTQVVVLFGGQNTGQEVSVSSAANVVRVLDHTGYEVTPVRITAGGRWIVGSPASAHPADENELWQATPDTGGLATAAETFAAAMDVMRRANVVFPALNGRHGADGTVQSILEHLSVPYVGTGVLAAVATSWLSERKTLVKVAVPGREVNVGVLETSEGELIVSPPLEIRVSIGHGFSDHQIEYQRRITYSAVPAALDAGTTRRLQIEAISVFRALDCAGMVQVAFLPRPSWRIRRERGQHVPRPRFGLTVPTHVEGRRPVPPGVARSAHPYGAAAAPGSTVVGRMSAARTTELDRILLSHPWSTYRRIAGTGRSSVSPMPTEPRPGR